MHRIFLLTVGRTAIEDGFVETTDRFIEAHAAVGPENQGAAAADWFYWKHLTALLDAVAGPRELIHG